MTITKDMDNALADEDAKVQCGKRAKPLRWRIGPSAMRALAIFHPDRPKDAGHDWRPTHYASIPIETVDAPPFDGSAVPNRFHGWMLVS